MVVEVTRDAVVISQYSVINTGEFCVNECEFVLPDCFEGLNVTAIFNNIPVPIIDNKCIIPALEKGKTVLGVYAYREGENGVEIMYSPRTAIFNVSQGSFSEEINEEAVPEISVYEQYCKMIVGKYDQLQERIKETEEEIQNNEAERKSVFKTNETDRQTIFDINETIRQAEYDGAYTNLLKNIAEESTTTDLPTNFPCHKIGSWYNKDSGKFVANGGFDCYLFEVSEGDRILVSNYITTGAMGDSMACVVDGDFLSLYSVAPQTSSNLLGGMYAMPENAKYIALNTPSGSSVPHVTLVSEGVIESKCVNIPDARKFISTQKNGTNHLVYNGVVGETLKSHWGTDSGTLSYVNGIYPLESGMEYVLHIPSLEEVGQYYNLAFLCDANFVVNRVVQQASAVSQLDFDKNNRFVFTATENDKYIAINTYHFAPAQFGKNKAKGIMKSISIGNAVFDGLHDISLKDMGVIDRSINKKFIAYGDSITLGAGIDYAIGVKRWTEYLVERYNIPEYINMGVGYSTLAYHPKNTEKAFCNDERLNVLINEAPDVVTILGGANDYGFDIPIGTESDIESKNIETFKGAYAYIIDKILTAKTDTTLVLLGMWHNTLGFYAPNPSRLHKMSDYATATKEIAEYFGLPFVDLNECGFNKYNFNTTDGVFSTDGVHPNAEGTKRIAMVVSRWFDFFKGTIY